MLKFKVIENEMPKFEEELNDFISKKDIEIVDVKYSTSGLAPDESYGWHTCNMHNALIIYNQNYVKKEYLM
jgi:Sporulation protein Cse60